MSQKILEPHHEYQENPVESRFTTAEALCGYLKAHDIDTSAWGSGGTKTLDHLLKEIQDGESVLVKGDEGRLLRKTLVAKADVYYKDTKGQLYRLKETKQVFVDGRERVRNSFLMEKMKPDENPLISIKRGVKEELGIDEEGFTVEPIDVADEIVDSPSYPGLKTWYILHRFKVVLSEDQVKPEGYTEKQVDKQTYFAWEKVQE